MGTQFGTTLRSFGQRYAVMDGYERFLALKRPHLRVVVPNCVLHGLSRWQKAPPAYTAHQLLRNSVWSHAAPHTH